MFFFGFTLWIYLHSVLELTFIHIYTHWTFFGQFKEHFSTYYIGIYKLDFICYTNNFQGFLMRDSLPWHHTHQDFSGVSDHYHMYITNHLP